MKFAEKRPVKIVMIGAGGTGGHVAPHLYRLLYSLNRPVRFIIADGDLVEKKNLVRQNFIEADLGENKAKVLAERYSSAFGLECEYIPEFIEDEKRLIELVTPHELQGEVMFVDGHPVVDAFWELVILIGAVDNNRSRQLCHAVFKKVSPLVYIDSGNGEHTGQVVCGIRQGTRTVFKPAGSIYPDILGEQDKFPTELSCAEASVSAPQSIVANIMAATAVVNFVYNILVRGQIDTRSVTFSTNTLNIKPNLVNMKRRKARCASFLAPDQK